MAKLLAERKSILKAGKRAGKEGAEKAHHDFDQTPSGSTIKRIQWTDTHTETHEEPVRFEERRHQEPTGNGEEIIRVREYRPRHHASLRSIEDDVDHINRFDTVDPAPRSYEERTVYETDRSTVRGARTGNRTTYFLEDEGRVSTRRTLHRSMIDEVIRDVNLDDEIIVQEEVVEYEPRIVEEVVPVKPAKKATKKPAKKPAKAAAKPKKAAATLYYDYKGDIHPVIEIEGIGPVYEKKLDKLGVRTTARLCYEDAAKLAKKLETDEKRVLHWQQMAELAKVTGIGPQYAEALVRAGVTGIQELKDRKPSDVAAQTSQYLEGLKNNVLGQKVTTQRVSTWQKHAKPMRRVKQVIPEE